MLIEAIFRDMYNMGLIYGPLWAPVSQNSGLCSFCQTISTGFASVLVYIPFKLILEVC